MAIVNLSHPIEGGIQVDTHKVRLRHLKARLNAWAIAMWEVMKTRQVTFVGVLLTYRPSARLVPGELNSAWTPNQINDYIRQVTKYYGDRILGYCWVVEFHESGAFHYHVCWALDGSLRSMRHADKMGWWVWGWSGTKTLKKAPSARYLTKYLQKGFDRVGFTLPKSMRVFAAVIRKHVEVPDAAKFWFRVSAAVAAVRNFILEKIAPFPGDNRYFKGWSWAALRDKDDDPELGHTGWLVKHFSRWWVVESEWRYVSTGDFDAWDMAPGYVGGAFNYV